MPASIFPSPEGTALKERNVGTVFARLLATADERQTASTTFGTRTQRHDREVSSREDRDRCTRVVMIG